MDQHSIPQHDHKVPLASSRFLPGWENAGRPLHQVFVGKGHVLNEHSMIHREFKPSKAKKGIKTPQPIDYYRHPKFCEWQLEMSHSLHYGKNVIADVTTSCGKTWAANLITAYEILSRETVKGSKATGLIISPNSEVMRDTVKDICEHHHKKYSYGGTTMIDTMTRNFATYDERRGPHAQIIVVAVECIETFVTDPVNQHFVEKLEIIVFDEVHLNTVTRGLWWSQYIPHSAQLVLLSATLGNPQDVLKIVDEIQGLQETRPRETHIIKYDVRPIPLQPLVFLGSEKLPSCGIRSTELAGAKKLACLPNLHDPTKRDLQSLNAINIPDDRESQYMFGQVFMNDNTNYERAVEKIKDGLKDANLASNAENMYNLLCYLFVNDKAPAMIFNTTAGASENLARTLVSHICSIEQADPEYRIAEKQNDLYNKEYHRARDQKSHTKSIEKDRNDWSKALPDEGLDKINIHDVKKVLQKYKFPSDIVDIPDNIPQWIKDALEYGIGVYVSSMKIWQLHIIFDLFRDGKIKVLISDSSISVGINLPIRTVIMCGNMSHSLYKQASGRAGRRGMDNQGFIVHLMPEAEIIKCLTTKTPEVNLNMPKKMTHSDLIRMLVPENLQKFYYMDPYIANKNGEVLSKFDDSEAKDIPEYSRTILLNYLATLDKVSYDKCINQIKLIHREQWHYHKLTNIIKTLPEHTSIILISLLTSGSLRNLDLNDFFNLMAILFNRIEIKHDSKPEDYYIPNLSDDIMEKIKKASLLYDIDINYNKPIHRYFYDFCRKQIVHYDLLSHIDSMGEWLYILKLGIMSVCPKEGKGKKAKPTDKFVQLVLQADTEYLSARASKSI